MASAHPHRFQPAGEYSSAARSQPHCERDTTANFSARTVVHLKPADPALIAAATRAPVTTGDPGPGAYEHANMHYSGASVEWIQAPRGAQTSAFKSEERKFALASAAGNPPPCCYELCTVRTAA